MANKNENKETKPKRNKYPSVLRYSGLGMQVMLIIGLGTYIGSWLDDQYQFEKNWFTLGFVLLSVALSMAYTIRILNRNNEK